MIKFLAFIILLPLMICLSALIFRVLWLICGMEEWTGLGPLPWGPAIFAALTLGGLGSVGSRK